MLGVKEITLNDTFTLCEMGFTNLYGSTFYKDYKNGFSLVLNPCIQDGIGKVKINFFKEKPEGEIDLCVDFSQIYDDINELIAKGIVIYE